MIEFIDHTGHTYSLPSYDKYPVGYEYQETPYIHDFTSVCGVKLSCNNYYMLPIRMVLLNELVHDNICITSDSAVFSLLGGKQIQEAMQQSGDFVFEIEESQLKKTLSIDDLIKIEGKEETVFIFYVIAYTESDESCAWSSSLMIKIYGSEEEGTENHETYVPLTVRADFYNEREELTINGKNLGISLPSEILKAVWNGSFYSDVFDEALYNEKLKEYLLNYMRLKVEKGNIQQAVSALKWFGWGDRLKIVKLLKNDNKVIAQYIRDFLNITSDNLIRHKHFLGTGLLSVFFDITEETNKNTTQTWVDESNNNVLIGEGKPIIESLIDKMTSVKYDEDDIEFYKPILEYNFTELSLKLSCLRTFYNKEFLPIHSMLHSASLQYHAWMNDIKFHIRPFVKQVEPPILLAQKKGTLEVKFPSINTQFIYIQQAYVDEDMNEMSWYANEGQLIDTNILYIDDVFTRIPIKISSTETDTFNCVLLIEREGKKVWESHFSFCQRKDDNNNLTRDWVNFVMFPRLMNSRHTMQYWADKNYRLLLLVNGKWFEYNFVLKVPEFTLNLGRLNYTYNHELHRQVNCITDDMVDFQSFMYLPSLIDVRNINFCRDLVQFSNDMLLHKFIDMYHEKPSIPFSSTSQLANRYWNRIHMFRIFENDVELMYDRDEDIVPLYRKLFNDDGTQKKQISQDGLDYDIYLMHDSTGYEDYKDILTPEQFTALTPRWYIVLISRQTIDNAITTNEPRIPDVKIDGWKLEHIGSDNKWLINRMTFEDKTDNPVFKGDDIIAGSLNGIKMPFMLQYGSHWEICPFSLGMEKDAKVTSNTNAFLMSLGGDNYTNERGYYNIVARYSLDGSVQHQKELRLRILVN